MLRQIYTWSHPYRNHLFNQGAVNNRLHMTPDHVDKSSQGNLVTQINFPFGTLVDHVVIQLLCSVHELRGMRWFILNTHVFDLLLVFVDLPITFAEGIGQVPFLFERELKQLEQERENWTLVIEECLFVQLVVVFQLHIKSERGPYKIIQLIERLQ